LGKERAMTKKGADIKLGYVIVYVPDVKEALRFYERAFGVRERFLHESGEYGELETGATALGFANETFPATRDVFDQNRPGRKAAGAEVAFVVTDVQVAYERALAAGAVKVSEPSQKPWGQVVAYVRDINGFLVELCTEVRE
jgi:catechol 2,3-dioxygenase-like lactoylglutathione lyase family enzyme